jgi:hypothetical protein
MTFKYKLSRRMAALPRIGCSVWFLAAACSAGDPVHYLDPNDPATNAPDTEAPAGDSPASDPASEGSTSTGIAGLTISPTSLTLASGASKTLTAQGWLVGSNTPVAASVTWTATGGTISQDGVYRAGSVPGTYRVAARSTTTAKADTIPVTITASTSVTPPPPTTSMGPNEPLDFTRLTEIRLDSPREDGWYVDSGNRYAIVPDATAPRSASSVLRATFRAGDGESTTPVRMQKNIDGAGLTQIYWSYWIKVSSNFQGHPTATKKINFAWMKGSPIFFMSAEGVGNGPLTLTARMQSPAESREYFRPNQGASGNFSRGSWHRVELIARGNTAGNGDGLVKVWLDGVRIIEYRDVRFTGSGQDKTFDYIDFTPIWGGRGGTVTNTMTMDLDHMYVSGKR